MIVIPNKEKDIFICTYNINEQTGEYKTKEYTEKELKREFTINEIDVTDPYWAKDTYNWTEEESDKFFETYYEEMMENVEPKEDVIDTINYLAKSNKIIIITARWDKENKNNGKNNKKLVRKTSNLL